MSALIERITFARERLAEGAYGSEASISAAVVLPVLDALGWPTYDPARVVPEYRVETRRVDFALLTRGTPAVFVEVKQPGTIDGADRQLFEYAFHVGVPMAVLTDGATWHVYLPAMQGSYDERRVYLLDLAERPPEESAERLARYLSRDAVESGEAEERAKADYKRSRQRRGAAEAIPQAWASLVGGESTRLVDVLAAEVQTLSGFQPHPDDVEAFLRGLAPSGRPSERAPRPSPTPSPRSRAGVAEPAPVRAEDSPSPGDWFGKGVVLPEGTELRARYRGVGYTARIERGRIVYDGQGHRSPSAAGVAITGSAVNGWTFWEARRPGDAAWRRLDTFR
jgi:hypothetical protein